MSQVTKRGEKPVASPALEAELAHRERAESRAPRDDDAPRRVSTFPPHKPPAVLPGQLAIEVSAPGAA